jgi:hypothetical protein
MKTLEYPLIGKKPGEPDPSKRRSGTDTYCYESGTRDQGEEMTLHVQYFRYKSPIGEFRISINREGRWELWFQDDVLGAYSNQVAPADDVYTQTTGSSEWDLFKIDDIPTDISEWECFGVRK